MDIIKKINKAKIIWEVLRKLTVEELENILKISVDSYYNSGESLISDEVYDILSDRLRELNPESEFFKEVGAPTKGKKVRLKYWMGSMNKFKTDDEIEKWTANRAGPYLLSSKLDGVSCLLTLSDGEYKLFTRGRGSEGQDISHLFSLVNMFSKSKVAKKLAGTVDVLDVRGELIMSKKNFEKYADVMANARNMVSGIVNSKKESVNQAYAADVDFVAYEIIEPRLLPSDQFSRLEELGFNVAANQLIDHISIEILDKKLKKYKANSAYEIDGLIITENKKHPRNTSGNPTYSFAYKGKSETAKTRVIKVEWTPQKDGQIIPTIYYNPVKLSGATLQKTAGFNARFIQDNKIGPGAIIKVVRSGDTIPYLMDVILPAKKPSFPSVDYYWDKNNVNIMLRNASANKTVIIRRLTKFVRDIGVENMSEGIVTRLVDAGYDTIPKIMKLTVDDLLKLDGFQQTLADKLVTNLDNSLKNLDMLTLMVASNCFGRGFGERKIRKILKVYPTIVDLYDTPERKKWSKKILEIEGFDTISTDSFLDSLPDFQAFYKIVRKIRPVKPFVAVAKTKGIFTDEVVVFTGFRNKEWQEFIEAEGGRVSTGVSGTTTIVVYKDGEESSAKYLAAKKLGKKMFSISEFKKKYNL